ncbi:hypothetical protein EVAR_88031_1 [Eumeta japonica]|uniref:Uncharacterized protein n=1 Tax=Eumeta variegata TaxID=151549 RepID=A0A4C1VC76_EUMVA|nr:hypothetical protein EVAR_88031_1 [Eumeta japonica]
MTVEHVLQSARAHLQPAPQPSRSLVDIRNVTIRPRLGGTVPVSGSLSRCPQRSQHSPGFASRPDDSLKFIFSAQNAWPDAPHGEADDDRARGAAPARVTQNYDVSIVKQEPLSGTESNDTDHFDEEGPPILCPILHNDPLEIATSIGRDDATVEKILKYQIRKLEHTDKCNRQKIKTLQHKVRVQSERIATLERLVRNLRRRDSLTEEEKTGLKAVDETSIKFIKEEPAQASDTEIKMEPEWIP